MALIIQSKITASFLNPPNTAPVCVEVNPKYLSKTYYEIQKGSRIVGKVLELWVDGDKVKGLEGLEVELIYGVGLLSDELFFTPDFWNSLREFGVTVGSVITLRLEKAIINGKEILLYPKRDVKWSILEVESKSI
jgi:hypothetical protein